MRSTSSQLGFFTSRCGLFSACLVVVMASVFAYTFLHRAESIIVEHELTNLRDEARLMLNQLEESIAQLREDVEYLARLPEVHKIVRARMRQQYRVDPSSDEKVLYDPVSGVSEFDLRNQLFDQFCKRCEARPYFQVRLIGKYYNPANPDHPVDGQEIVRAFRVLRPEAKEITRANRASGDWSAIEFSKVEPKDLDSDARRLAEARRYNKSSAEYYTRFATWHRGWIPNHKTSQNLYLSGININREHGKIEGDYAQTLRASVPVKWFDVKGEPFFGVLVINMDFDVVTDGLREHPRFQSFVTDNMFGEHSYSRLLVHPDTAAEFIWDLREDARNRHQEVDPVRSQAFDVAQLQLGRLWQKAKDKAGTRRDHSFWTTEGVALGDIREQDIEPLSASTLGRPLHVWSFKADFARFPDLSEQLEQSVRKFNFPPDANPRRFRVRLKLDKINSRFQLTCIDDATLNEFQHSFAVEDKEEKYEQLFQSPERSFVGDEFDMRIYRLYFDPGKTDRYLQVAIAASYDEFRSAFADTRWWIIGVTIVISIVGLVTSLAYSRFLGRLEKLDADGRQELDQANRYKSAGLRGIWQELMPPMQLIHTKADALRNQTSKNGDGIVAQELEWISRSSEESLDFLANLREFARCQDHEFVVNRAPFSIKDCVEQCVRDLQVEFEEKQLNVELNLTMAPDTVWGNRTWIKHVITNLLTNAKKYTDVGGDIVIRAETVVRPTNGVPAQVRISVVDTGFGIPDSEKDMVFNDFHRCSNVKDETPGVGIGLSFARRLVELHKGQMGFESELDHGSQFWFTLPLADESQQEITSPQALHGEESV